MLLIDLLCRFQFRLLFMVGILACAELSISAGALEKYVSEPDSTYSWKRTESLKMESGSAVHLELVSQTWRGQFWSHHLLVVRPEKVRNPHIAFLFITGDGEGTKSLAMLDTIAQRAGAVAAVLTKVPNQPLYNGKKEDSLIAFTFDQYLRSKDESWPLLFPMVKSAVRGMDTVQAFTRSEWNLAVEKFVVSGASKRGWTTWLTGAVDPRVCGIAPMVIDMLNMKAQTDWARKMYGKQSEQISDYTDLNLVDRVDDPDMKQLREWVDPYAYISRYTMPKLLLLGTNDPYWVVDSLRHYWNQLPEPKLVFQTPNAGHDLAGGKEATQTLAAWFQMIADGETLPEMHWTIRPQSSGKTSLAIQVKGEVNVSRLWMSESPDRDFRNDRWTSSDLATAPKNGERSAEIEKPAKGFRAYMGEVTLTSSTGHPYKLSTEARVVPDAEGSP